MSGNFKSSQGPSRESDTRFFRETDHEKQLEAENLVADSLSRAFNSDRDLATLFCVQEEFLTVHTNPYFVTLLA